jgi:hypothetical protein
MEPMGNSLDLLTAGDTTTAPINVNLEDRLASAQRKLDSLVAKVAAKQAAVSAAEANVRLAQAGQDEVKSRARAKVDAAKKRVQDLQDKLVAAQKAVALAEDAEQKIIADGSPAVKRAQDTLKSARTAAREATTQVDAQRRAIADLQSKVDTKRSETKARPAAAAAKKADSTSTSTVGSAKSPPPYSSASAAAAAAAAAVATVVPTTNDGAPASDPALEQWKQQAQSDLAAGKSPAKLASPPNTRPTDTPTSADLEAAKARQRGVTPEDMAREAAERVVKRQAARAADAANLLQNPADDDDEDDEDDSFADGDDDDEDELAFRDLSDHDDASDKQSDRFRVFGDVSRMKRHTGASAVLHYLEGINRDNFEVVVSAFVKRVSYQVRNGEFVVGAIDALSNKALIDEAHAAARVLGAALYFRNASGKRLNADFSALPDWYADANSIYEHVEKMPGARDAIASGIDVQASEWFLAKFRRLVEWKKFSANSENTFDDVFNWVARLAATARVNVNDLVMMAVRAWMLTIEQDTLDGLAAKLQIDVV